MLHASSGLSSAELPLPADDAVTVLLVGSVVLGIIAYDAYRYHWGA
ncbi:MULTISPECIES: hypothetical protein [Halostella]|nr:MULTISPECIES: hypothetical protein [Halostella]